MDIGQVHLEIARERFLELMGANPAADVQTAAIVATAQADTFAAVYKQYGYRADAQPVPMKKAKGCRACYGSGGKSLDPCKVCHGTGKVPA